MKLELLIVGNELLQGKITDLNGVWLAKLLQNKSIELTKVSIIADSVEQIISELEIALQRNDVVLVSGGLGPTQDDITKSCLARYFGKELKEGQQALEVVEKNYTRNSREYKKENSFYHLLPEGFIALNNPTGYAPGLQYESKGKLIFALPGVPHEFASMFEQEILPQIENNKTIKQIFNIRTVGIAEEKIFKELCPNLWSELEEFGKVSSLPQIMNVDISVTIQAESNEVIQSRTEQIKTHILKSELAQYVWHFGQEDLEEVILERAQKKNLSFGFAESCTGGLNASRITDIAGSSASFMGSAVTYSNEAKMKILSVSEKTLQKYGAVSEQTAIEMARGALIALDTDIAIATTGIAGPGGGSQEKPVGTIAIAYATKHGVEHSSLFHFKGHRKLLKQRFSQKALFILLEVIENS